MILFFYLDLTAWVYWFYFPTPPRSRPPSGQLTRVTARFVSAALTVLLTKREIWMVA